MLGSYEEAVQSYETALELRPGWQEAIENRDLVRSLIPPTEEDQDPAPSAPPAKIPDWVLV